MRLWQFEGIPGHTECFPALPGMPGPSRGGSRVAALQPRESCLGWASRARYRAGPSCEVGGGGGGLAFHQASIKAGSVINCFQPVSIAMLFV